MGYGITIRVYGPYALFTRPEFKTERVSYEVITPSAARGIIEAVYWKPAIRWKIDRIHVLNEPQFVSVRRNEVSEKISVKNVRSVLNGKSKPIGCSVTDTRQQRAAMFLKNVDYVIEAHFEMTDRAGADDTEEKHYNVVLRRLRRGQCFHHPYLGTRECGATVELIEDERAVPKSPLKGERDLGWMLYDLDFSKRGDIQPMFYHVVMKDGVIEVPEPGAGVRR